MSKGQYIDLLRSILVKVDGFKATAATHRRAGWYGLEVVAVADPAGKRS